MGYQVGELRLQSFVKFWSKKKNFKPSEAHEEWVCWLKAKGRGFYSTVTFFKPKIWNVFDWSHEISVLHREMEKLKARQPIRSGVLLNPCYNHILSSLFFCCPTGSYHRHNQYRSWCLRSWQQNEVRINNYSRNGKVIKYYVNNLRSCLAQWKSRYFKCICLSKTFLIVNFRLYTHYQPSTNFGCGMRVGALVSLHNVHLCKLDKVGV